MRTDENGVHWLTTNEVGLLTGWDEAFMGARLVRIGETLYNVEGNEGAPVEAFEMADFLELREKALIEGMSDGRKPRVEPHGLISFMTTADD